MLVGGFLHHSSFFNVGYNQLASGIVTLTFQGYTHTELSSMMIRELLGTETTNSRQSTFLRSVAQTALIKLCYLIKFRYGSTFLSLKRKP